MDVSLISGLKVLEEESKRLKKMYTEKSMQNDFLKEMLGKKWLGCLNARNLSVNGAFTCQSADGPEGGSAPKCQYSTVLSHIPDQRDLLSA